MRDHSDYSRRGPDGDSDDRTVMACPGCDGTRLRMRTSRGKKARSGNPDHKWSCRECGHTFDTPNERPRKHGGGKGADTILSDCIDRIKTKNETETENDETEGGETA